MDLSNQQDIDCYLNLGSPPLSPLSNHLLHSHPVESLVVEDIPSESQILLDHAQSSKQLHATEGSKTTSNVKKKVSMHASVKYREKKKKYTQELDESVKELEEQLRKTDEQLNKVKDSIVEKLSTAAKSLQSSENAQIFIELETILSPDSSELEVDIDKINLLLDTLKYRIGPSGRERQAKLNYNFKNIINSFFPGIHRYLMATAVKDLDMFKKQPHSQLKWTQELMKTLSITDQQKTMLQSLKNHLVDSHKDVMVQVSTLLSTKRKLKEEGLRFDAAQNQFRECMNPIQCGKWTLWCEKNKYYQDIFMQQASRHFYEDETAEKGLEGRKRVHRSN